MARPTKWQGHSVKISRHHYARSILAAEDLNETVDSFVDRAVANALAVHDRQRAHQAGQSPRPNPMPFVRPTPEASGLSMAGRPSSRHYQNGTAAQAASKAAQPGPERPTAPRSAASMARTREDLPFDGGEHRGTHTTTNSPRQ